MSDWDIVMLVRFSVVTVVMLRAAGSVLPLISEIPERFFQRDWLNQERFWSMTKERDEWSFPCSKLISE